MKIKDFPISERPREKLIKYGKENLTDGELLAIILKTGYKDENVCDLGAKILKCYGGISKLKDVSFGELVSIKGIGEAKATELLAIVEISKRIYFNAGHDKVREKYTNPTVIYENNKYLFDNLKQEYFYCLYLNSKKELIERKLLFMGTLNKSVVHPREVFKEAYKVSASSIVCLHNHPSGNFLPSKADIEFTESLIKIGQINGIPVIDHLIITDEGYYSFYRDRENVL